MSLEGIRVAITGGTGFLGGALARALLEEGAEVHVLARPQADRSRLDGLSVTWHDGDVLVPESLHGFANADWIIHAAGRLGEYGVAEHVYQRLHVNGTRNILAITGGIKPTPRVLYVSSPGVLGPIAGNPANECAPLAPSNPYERSKATAEGVALDFASSGLDVIIARPEFIYGPGDRHVLGLFRAIQRRRFFYLDSGKHFCHPTFISDAVTGLLLCLRLGRSGEVYHITGPRPVTFREMGETIANASGVPPPRVSLPSWLAMAGATGLEVFGQITGWKPPLSRTGVGFFSEDRRFSWEKASRDLGYSPQYDLSAGISRTVEWYRQHGWL
jgi:oxidoreductase